MKKYIYLFFLFSLFFLIGCGDDEYRLHLTIDGKGIISLNGTQYEESTTVDYEYNDVVTVAYDATTYDEWEFVSFSGDLTGSSNSQRLTINEEKYVTATFQLENSVAIDGYVKDTNSTVLENVIVSSGTSDDNKITSTTSSTGYYQLKNIPVPSDKKVYVTFQRSGYEEKTIYFYKEKAETRLDDVEMSHLYELTIINDSYNKGSSSPVPGTYSFIENEIKSITAVYSTVLLFNQWSGDVPSSENASSVGISITMDKNRTIVAEFLELTTCSIHLHWNPVQGTVSQNPSGITQASGTSVTLSCTPKTDYNFNSWINQTGNIFSSNPLTILLDSNSDYTCTFAEKTNSLTVSITGQGIVKKSPDLSAYPPDSQVQLTAIPAQGWKFRKWGGDIDSTDQKTTITMDTNKAIEVLFEKPYASFSGQVVNTNGTGLSSVQISSGNQSTTSDSNGFFLLENAEIPADVSHATVLFEKEGFCLLKQVCSVQDQQLINLTPILSDYCTIDITISGEGNVICSQNDNPLNQLSENFQSFTLLAQSYQDTRLIPIPKNKDVLFKEWSGDISGSDHPHQFNLIQDMSITAEFIDAPYAGKIDLPLVINMLQILTAQPLSTKYSIDINENNQRDISEVILMMQYISDND